MSIEDHNLPDFTVDVEPEKPTYQAPTCGVCGSTDITSHRCNSCTMREITLLPSRLAPK